MNCLCKAIKIKEKLLLYLYIDIIDFGIFLKVCNPIHCVASVAILMAFWSCVYILPSNYLLFQNCCFHSIAAKDQKNF